jgi:glutamyl-tRNA synthetase/nondiscriminating glutamyl-tRNA synthetase
MYEALGWSPPRFAHLSMVLGPDHAPLSKRHGATSVAEFRERGYLCEALVNYLALLGWSPGDNQEIVPLGEMATRFRLEDVSHSAAVFDTDKLAWMNRHYMKEAPGERIAREAWRYMVRTGHATSTTRRPAPEALAYFVSVLPMAVGSVDRLEEIPERLAFLFAWQPETAAGLVREEAGGAEAIRAFAEAVANLGPLDRDAFRAAAGVVRERTGLKGKSLFHPIRVALTAAASGPELDLAVPAIDRGAALEADSGLRAILSCRERAARVAACLAI